jgi:POT family proton-dependent oligopeptide transporter
LLFATGALFLIGNSRVGWLVVLAIGVFSAGEMLSSPKFSEFVGNFAPSDKKAMYLGFAQISIGLGWVAESKLGMVLYDHFASKENFARTLLIERGMARAAVDRIPQGEAFQQAVTFTHSTRWDLTDQLYRSHSVGTVWYIMAAVGAVTAVGIYLYGRWILALTKRAQATGAAG